MKKTIICLIISLGVACLLLSLEQNTFYQVIDLKLYDVQMTLRPTPTQDPRILFVEMDDKAIRHLGRWPWPRNIFAAITDTLQSLGARQILFDVTFAQPTQPIVNKEVTPFIFQGEKEIKEYLQDITGEWKGKASIPQKDALLVMEQTQSGFLEFTNAAQKKLQYAMTDNDQALSEAFQRSPSFIGYSFEILTEPQDIERDRQKQQLEQAMTVWIKDHPEGTFNDLPPLIKDNSQLTANVLKEIFIRSKLRPVIKKNLEISLHESASQLGLDAQRIKTDFDSVKKGVIEERILSLLIQNPDISAVAITHQLEIMDIKTQKLIKDTYPSVKNQFAATAKFGQPLSKNQDFLKAIAMDPPIEQFTKIVKGGGFLNGIPHQDGVLRFVPLFIEYKDRIFPHIAIASALDLYKPKKISFEPGKYFILHQAHVGETLEDIRIPIDHKGATFINWTGRWKDCFRHISGADIYQLSYLRETFLNNPNHPLSLQKQLKEKEAALKNTVNGSICIIGLTATGTHDFNPIPYESTYPMVGTHGNVLNSILTRQFITQAPRSINLIILFTLAIVIGLVLSLFSSANGLFFTAFALAGTFLTSLYWFNQGIWLNLASPLLLCLFSYLGITSYKFATEEKSKREIKNAFSKYVSPDVIEEIIQDPSKLRLGGDRRTLTVLFSDIRGFTTYSEKRNPEEVVTILNEYLDAMTNVVVEHKGTLDKYVGDEIMAVFGAPKPEPPETSSLQAVTCAVKMLKRLKELQAKWAAEGLEPLDIGIGINTGDMVVGNMGSELRMDYTVIGDAVNLGARVEALTRQFNAHLIITESTYTYIKDFIDAKPLEAIKVKGKEIPVMIYEILGLKETSEPLVS